MVSDRIEPQTRPVVRALVGTYFSLTVDEIVSLIEARDTLKADGKVKQAEHLTSILHRAAIKIGGS